MLNQLTTTRGEQLLASQDAPWQEYPRPQMRRDSYVNLNGDWEFSALDYSGSIRVPFCPESLLSGVNRHFPEGCPLVYRKKFTLPENFQKDRVLLHIGGADQIAKIYINHAPIGTHVGGYEAFSLDITSALKEGENEIQIRVYDDLTDQSQPYGKQVLPEKRGGMWYTPVSGIWQSVWLESVPETYIQKLNIQNQGASVIITTVPEMTGTVHVKDLGDFPLGATITPNDPHLWTPETPYLYDFTVETETDRVDSYFAIRYLETKVFDGIPRLCLNGKPYFFHGLLDQGYWPDGLLTPPSPDCYVDDILQMKALGFNTLRKHIKVEPDLFYYHCARLGMVVFQDMVNNGDYSFFRDTALPTIGLQKLDDRRLHRDRKTREEFLRQMKTTVKQLENHPCICYWTIFNEGWGQFDSDAVFRQFQTLDNSRFIDTTSGWFRRKNSHVDSRHVYFKPIRLKGDGKPLVLSEFGGYSYQPEGHIFNTDSTYGYGKFKTQTQFEEALVALYTQQVIPAYKQGLCAAIYTQVSDVEDETNGLLTYDRKVCKVSANLLTPIAQALNPETK